MSFTQYYFKEKNLNEVLSNELIYLKKYLNMPDNEKDYNRAYNLPYYINDYLNEIDYDKEFGSDYEYYEIIDWLEQNDKDVITNYGKWLLDYDGYINSNEQELYDMADYIGFIRNKWLIHFSDDADQIAKDQKFSIGIPYDDYNRLGLSTHFSTDYKKSGGFNFAFDTDEVHKYYKDKRGNGNKYGDEAILFKGDGIKIYHYGDEEKQVIFDGNATNSPLIHLENEDGDWVINSIKTGEKLIRKEDIDDITSWVDRHYDQYRKHLRR